MLRDFHYLDATALRLRRSPPDRDKHTLATAGQTITLRASFFLTRAIPSHLLIQLFAISTTHECRITSENYLSGTFCLLVFRE